MTIDRSQRSAVLALARVEARRALKGPAFWIGLALTVWAGITASQFDWQGATYAETTLTFAPLATGVFVAGALAGGRDRRADDRPELAEEAALDSSARSAARLLGLLPLVVIGAVLVVGVAIGVRVEGGQWIGDAPGRSDTEVHGVAEIFQPILWLVLAGATGVAGGRAFRRRTPVVVAGLVIGFLFTGAFWVWQWPPMSFVVPVQSQPIEVAIDGAPTSPNALPADWLLIDPNERGGEWHRAMVHQPLAAWHDVYLVGLATLAVGIAVRGRRGRQVMLAGLVVVAFGLTMQAVVIPDGAVGIDIVE